MFVSIIIYLFIMVQTSGNILCYYNQLLASKDNGIILVGFIHKKVRLHHDAEYSTYEFQVLL